MLYKKRCRNLKNKYFEVNIDSYIVSISYYLSNM